MCQCPFFFNVWLLRRVAPEPFEVVETARLIKKDMRHHVAVIEKNPEGLIEALCAQKPMFSALQYLYDIIRDGADLSRGVTACYYEIIADARHLPHVYRHYVERFFG
jgi:hypothetical protein